MKFKLIFGLMIISVVLSFSGCLNNSPEKPVEYKIVQIQKIQYSNAVYYHVYFIKDNITFDTTIKENTDDSFKYLIFSNKTRFLRENPSSFSSLYVLYLNKSDINSDGVYITGLHAGD